MHPNSSPIERASALFVSLAAPPLRSIKPSKRGVCSRGRREVHAVIYHIGNNRNWQNTCFARAPQNQPKKRRKKQGKGREREREGEREVAKEEIGVAGRIGSRYIIRRGGGEQSGEKRSTACSFRVGGGMSGALSSSISLFLSFSSSFVKTI